MEKVKNFFGGIGTAIKDEFIGTWKGITTEKIKFSTLLLVIVNIVCLLISNIIAVKTITFLALGNGIKFALPSAVLIYGIAIILSDVLAEVDYIWTRRSAHIGFIANLFMVLIFTITIYIPGTIGTYSDAGTISNWLYGDAFTSVDGGLMNTVLGSSWFMLIASVTSFYFGDLLNDTVFKKLHAKDGEGNSKLLKRCVVSTMFGQLIDAGIFVTLGLQVLPGVVLGYTFTGGSSLADPIGWANMGIMIGLQWIVKVLWELLVSPLVILICNKVKSKEPIIE